MSKPETQDHYAVLGIELSASTSEVARAYRKLALKYHPDRNPDDKDAGTTVHIAILALVPFSLVVGCVWCFGSYCLLEIMFLAVGKAYEVLSNAEEREKFDKVVRAKVLQQQKVEAMDKQRRKLREDLEEREERARTVGKTAAAAGSDVRSFDARCRVQECADCVWRVQMDRLREGGMAMMEALEEKRRAREEKARRAATAAIVLPSASVSEAASTPSERSAFNFHAVPPPATKSASGFPSFSSFPGTAKKT